MSRSIAAVLAVLLAAVFAGSAAADQSDRATARFAAEHPGARFVEDASAARWYIVHGFATPPITGDPAAAAEQFIAAHRELIGLGHPASAVELARIVPHRERRAYQFRQTFGGLPVLDAAVIALVDGHRRIVMLSSTAVAEPRQAAPQIDEAEAVAAVHAVLPDAGAPRGIELGYLPIGDRAALVYRVVVPAAGVHLWQVDVDALSGRILGRSDLVRRHDAAVFLENPVVDSESTTELFLPNLDTGDHANHTFGSLARVASCTATDSYGYCTAWEHAAVADDNGFLDELPLLDAPTDSPDGFAEVNAYYHLDEQNSWVRSEFGFDGTWVDPETLVAGDHIWAHTDIDWPNAAYVGGWGDDPASIMLGQGAWYSDEVDFAYDGDVVRHEFTHALADAAFSLRGGSRDELGYDGTGGGVQEGTADYFGLTRFDNPQLAEYALGADGRSADNDFVCPDDVTGESHNDGMVLSGALWELRQELGATKVDHLHYGALASTSIRCFEQYAAALVAQAELMQDEVGELQFTAADVELVEEVVAARALAGCDRIYSLWQDDEPVTKRLYNGWDFTDGLGSPATLQLLAPTFDDTAVLTLLVTPLADPLFDVLVRKDEPVLFEWSDGGWPATWEATYDHKWTGPATEFKISDITEYELEPGADYYFSILCRATTADGCYNEATMSLSDQPEGTEDAGADGDADTDTDGDAGADAGPSKKADAGCGCRAAGSSSSIAPLLRLIAALL